MPQRPLVSVIVPNYNYAGYLPSRLDSVLGQDYGNIEVIILDDASTDDSWDVISRYSSDSRVRHTVRNCRNSGNPFLQWQAGLDLAAGQYVWIAESDDLADSRFLSALVFELESDSSCMLAYSSSVVIDAWGRVAKSPPLTGRTLRCSGTVFLKRYMSTANRIFNASAAVFRKSALLQTDGAFTSMRAAGDYLFWVQIARQGNVAYVRGNYNQYRIHSGSVTVHSVSSGISSSEDRRVLDYIKDAVGISDFREALSAAFHRRLYSKAVFCSEDIRSEVFATWSKGDSVPGFVYGFCFFVQACVKVLFGKLI